MSVRVLFFAQAEEWMGRPDIRIEAPCPLSLDDFLEDGALLPLRERRKWVRFSVNREFADLGTVVHDGDEVGVLPPVSGG